MTQLTDQQIANVAELSGWRGNDLIIAIAVVFPESGGRSDAVSPPNKNGSRDYGLWQVNSVHGFPTKELLTAVGNGKDAHLVWTWQGWNAWTTYRDGAYRPYLARATAAAGGAGIGGDVGGGVGLGPTPTSAAPPDWDPAPVMVKIADQAHFLADTAHNYAAGIRSLRH